MEDRRSCCDDCDCGRGDCCEILLCRLLEVVVLESNCVVVMVVVVVGNAVTVDSFEGGVRIVRGWDNIDATHPGQSDLWV